MADGMAEPARDTPIPAPGDVIVATKLHIPRRRAGLIAREVLVAALVQGSSRRLTLLSAPAGSGKTTLLGEWHRSRSEQRPFAWVSLDEGDNDEVRFWTYVIEALRTVANGVGEAAASALRAPRTRITDFALPLLVNDLSARGTEAVLVLDDYHLIVNQRIHEGVAYLLDHLSEGLQLAIATRSEPPLQLARMRARDEVTEVGAADLRFTDDEAVAFLNGTLGLGLEREDLVRLQRRTEGWPAGLYLVALSLRDRHDRHSFVESFEGDDRQIVDYLLSEVLAGQAGEVRSFLLRTSLLARLNAGLSDAVTGAGNAAPMLERIERSNLFLVPLDTRREWYRYHNLFADLLRHELRRREPELVPELHRRAYAWCAQAGLVAEAISHAAAAGDRDAATELVVASWSEYFNRGQLGTVSKWLVTIGEQTVVGDVGLCVASAWLALDEGRLPDAQRWIEHAETAIGSTEDAGTTAQADLATLRAVHSFKTGDVGQAARAATRVLALAPEGASFARAAGTSLLGITRYWQGAAEDALATLSEGERLARESGNLLAATYALGYSATILAEGEALDEAERLAGEAMSLAEDPAIGEHFVAMMAYLGRGRVRLRRGEPQLAEADFSRAVELSRRRAAAIEVAFALVELARARTRAGAARRAAADIDAARRTIQGCADPGTVATSLERAAMALRRGGPGGQATEEDLTDRELDVLRLLGSELSQREIGDTLYVSLNTVKTHTRGIFRKLDASNREEAVSKAHELGLL
jgi:LuxR family transcriptional regulator, maltose regulon positive regulatory protein